MKAADSGATFQEDVCDAQGNDTAPDQPDVTSAVGLSNDVIHKQMRPNCVPCHSEGAEKPYFGSIDRFETLIVADVAIIMPEASEVSSLVDFLKADQMGYMPRCLQMVRHLNSWPRPARQFSRRLKSIAGLKRSRLAKLSSLTTMSFPRPRSKAKAHGERICQRRAGPLGEHLFNRQYLPLSR